ncbi:MAG: iron-sulfur cluster-binding domain-containing protein [Bacteroidota bacterium]|nr:iron-sulfur cluster-binding domain-containing protein [Bacteroidota bacterium]
MEPFWVEVVGIFPEARDCSTIVLRRLDGQPLVYRAGQFLTFLLTIHGRELRRSYSFSSAPGIDPWPAITIKRVPNGEASRYLLDHLVPGDRLLTLPPSGRFTLEAAGGGGAGGAAARHFFIAAGSGMAPVYSLLKTALLTPAKPAAEGASGPAADVVLISQQHDEQSVLFGEALRGWQRQWPERFTWINILSSHFGRLTNLMLQDLVGEWSERPERNGQPARQSAVPFFYLCGPPACMRMAQFTLRLMGVEEARIRREHFTVEYVPPPPPLVDTLPKQIQIVREGQTIVFDAAYPQTILQAALAHGVELPYSCRGGRCSTCVARCLAGKVKMSINEVLTDEDLQRGLVLTCVGYAETDVELAY